MRSLVALFLCAAALAHAEDRHTVVSPGSAQSALGTAREFLRHLSQGELAKAAALSNAPHRRLEVLRDYQARVGEEEFKRVFSQYLERQDNVVAEVAIGAHRLIIWDLGGPAGQLSGQYYVDVDGRFLMDDVPNATRADLRRVLHAYRKAAKPSGQKD